jgi:NO-binding membrane sensor protein with MHYT domain
MWTVTAGAATGCGIWATHFIAMLAYDPGIVVGYGMVLTALSLVVAIMVTSAGLGLAVNGESRWSAPAGGAIVGGGVACMHYLGMWALEAPGHVSWSADLVVASITVGMLFGTAALMIAVRSAGMRATFVAGLLLTLAITSHHFTAMGAVELVPDPARTLSSLSLSPNLLAVAIAGVALSVLGMSFIGVLADRRLAARTDKFEKIIQELSEARRQTEVSQQELEEQKFRLDMAVDNMSHGLLLFDASERIVICNRRYIEMYGLSPEIVKPGCALRDLILHRQVLTPLDLEREFGLTEGNIFQGELTLEQLFFARPIPGWAQYATPIRNLWMCGSATHPGGGIMGAPGRNAALRILGRTA